MISHDFIYTLHQLIRVGHVSEIRYDTRAKRRCAGECGSVGGITDTEVAAGAAAGGATREACCTDCTKLERGCISSGVAQGGCGWGGRES